jgi:hypothetical protein
LSFSGLIDIPQIDQSLGRYRILDFSKESWLSYQVFARTGSMQVWKANLHSIAVKGEQGLFGVEEIRSVGLQALAQIKVGYTQSRIASSASLLDENGSICRRTV